MKLGICAVLLLALGGCGSAMPGGHGSAPSLPPPPGPASASPFEGEMSEDRFWSIVDGTSGGGVDAQAAAVKGRLAALSAEDVVAYEKRFVDLSNGILTWAHLGAAEVILGFTSEDVFTDLRTWVVFQGRDVYTSFRTDPDSLAAHGPSDDEELGAAEALEFLAEDVYQDKTGGDLVDRPDFPGYLVQPSGERIDDSNAALAKRFPKLAARYLRGVDPGGSPADGPRPVS